MIESTFNENVLSLGQQLKNARQSLNLSLEEVASKTNLKQAHLESLENDIFILPDVPPAFVRGYVRNYIRFLRLPESLVSSVSYGEVTIPEEVKKISSSVPTNHKSQGKLVKFITIAVLLAAIGMTLAWWWQGYKQDQANRFDVPPASSSANADTSVALPSATESSTSSSTDTSTSVPVADTSISMPSSTDNNANSNAVNIDTSSSQPSNLTDNATITNESSSTSNAVLVVPTENAVQSQPQPIVEQTASEPVNVLQMPTADNQNATANDTNPATEQPQAIGNDELRIEISGSQSWITVRGAKNKRLAEKLYNAGDVLTFNDNEQYRLTIGAPANVKLFYKGQQIPLKVDGRVARIKLPLAQ